jgi:hypothetical protein
MSDDTKKMPKVGRRDTLKLATAVTALGAGLGVVLDADDAIAAEGFKLAASELGNMTIKLYKLDATGKTAPTLLETIDVGALSQKMSKGGAFSLKFYNHKQDAAVMLSEHSVAIEPAKIAPVAPAPIQAPPALKR